MANKVEKLGKKIKSHILHEDVEPENRGVNQEEYIDKINKNSIDGHTKWVILNCGLSDPKEIKQHLDEAHAIEISISKIKKIQSENG